MKKSRQADKTSELIVQKDAEALAKYGTVFTHFLPPGTGVGATDEEIIVNDMKTVTLGMWTGDVPMLSTFTSSDEVQINSAYSIRNFSFNSQVQFGYAYGHYAGSASAGVSAEDGAENAFIYHQFRTMLLDNPEKVGNEKFKFYEKTGSEDCFFIALSRERMKAGGIQPGNWRLKLAGTATYILTDDSSVPEGDTVCAAGRRYNLVSGSIPASTQTYGFVYPDAGVIVIDAASVVPGLGIGRDVEDIRDAMNSGADFSMVNAEQVKSTHYIVKVPGGKYNFSNNPTFVSGSDSYLSNSDFNLNPTVWITTVGLYDESNRLVAVGKLSRPIRKSFDRAVTIKVRLDY